MLAIGRSANKESSVVVGDGKQGLQPSNRTDERTPMYGSGGWCTRKSSMRRGRLKAPDRATAQDGIIASK